LGVSERTIRRAIAAGKLRVVRIGRCVRVPTDAVSALLSGPTLADVKSATDFDEWKHDRGSDVG
jgi:excisionase family DNA binding protein